MHARPRGALTLLTLSLAGCASAAHDEPARATTTVAVAVSVRCVPGQSCDQAPQPRARVRAPVEATALPIQQAVLVPRSERPPSPVTAIFAGHQHACSLHEDHRLFCWGRNDRGQTAQEDRRRVTCSRRDADCVAYEGDDRRTWAPAVVAALSGVRTASLGESVSCAVTDDGAVRCWGYHGQMRGRGDTHEAMRAVRPVLGLSNPSQLHLGLRGGCAVSDTGDVRCFEAGSLEPETARRMRAVRQVIEGDYQVCGWDGGDSLRCYDIGQRFAIDLTEHARFVAHNPVGWAAKFSAREVCAWNRRGRVECAGDSGGYATGTVRMTEVAGLRDVAQVAGGEHHYCARTEQGAVWCWGNNSSGQLGDGTDVDRNVPVRVERLPEAVSIAAGSMFTCAIVRDGRVLCWGDNAWGQLGGADRRERARRDPAPVLW